MSNGKYRIVKCPYCGAEYRVPSTVTYATCPYCGTTFKIDNPGEKIEHYLFKPGVDKNKAYKLLKGFVSQLPASASDVENIAEFVSSKIFYVPVYIYEIDVLAPCREELEELKEENIGGEGIKLSVHGGEEVNYVLVPALDELPIPLPRDYYFPARARMYFKPTILKNGVYLQPVKDPLEIFVEVKKPSIDQAVNEAKISCGKGYELIDNSRYVGIAHYPFWQITYRYRGKEYKGLVDAADGTIVYAEYPMSFKGRLTGLIGGLTTTILAGLIGGGIAWKAYPDFFIFGFIGGLLAASPGLIYTLILFLRIKGKYLFKPGEEAVFLPVR